MRVCSSLLAYVTGLFCLLVVTLAQQSSRPNIVFTIPSQNTNNYDTIYHVGQTVTVSWTSDRAWTSSTADLFLTWAISDAYAALLEANINLQTLAQANYQWTVNLNSSLIGQDNRFVFRLRPHQDDPSSDPVAAYSVVRSEDWADSRGFLVLANAASSTTSGSASSSSQASSTSTQTNTSSSSTSTSVPQQGLSKGAIAGIAVAAVVVCGALFAGGYLFAYRKRKSKASTKQQGYVAGTEQEPMAQSFGRHELTSTQIKQTTTHELPGENGNWRS